jgi:hypothetical protein
MTGIMLGGQHHAAPKPVKDGVVKVQYAQRTHAYGCRGDYMRGLYRRWATATVHIDWVMGGGWQEKHKVYAPSRWLMGQDRGRSNINGRINSLQTWNSGDPQPAASVLADKYVVVLKAPRNVLEELAEHHGFHCGYWRGGDGIDNGLRAVAKKSGDERRRELTKWFACLKGEAAIVPDGVVTVWGIDDLSVEELEKASGLEVIELEGQTVDEVLKKWGEQR